MPGEKPHPWSHDFTCMRRWSITIGTARRAGGFGDRKSGQLKDPKAGPQAGDAWLLSHIELRSGVTPDGRASMWK